MLIRIMITIVKSVWSSPYVDCEGDVYVRFRTDGIVNNWIALSRHPKHAPFTWYDNYDETNDASYNYDMNDANDNDDPKHAALPWYNDYFLYTLFICPKREWYLAIFPTSPFGKSSELCVLLFIGTKAVFLWQYFPPQQPFGMNYDFDKLWFG